MFEGFYRIYETTKTAIDTMIVHNIPRVYADALVLITSGSQHKIIAGILMALGITLMIQRGLWKMILRVVVAKF